MLELKRRERCGKRYLRCLYTVYQNRSFCQDRPGIHIGKDEGKAALSAGLSCTWIRKRATLCYSSMARA